jgi:hypothetical protein
MIFFVEYKYLIMDSVIREFDNEGIRLHKITKEKINTKEATDKQSIEFAIVSKYKEVSIYHASFKALMKGVALFKPSIVKDQIDFLNDYVATIPHMVDINDVVHVKTYTGNAMELLLIKYDVILNQQPANILEAIKSMYQLNLYESKIYITYISFMSLLYDNLYTIYKHLKMVVDAMFLAINLIFSKRDPKTLKLLNLYVIKLQQSKCEIVQYEYLMSDMVVLYHAMTEIGNTIV